MLSSNKLKLMIVAILSVASTIGCWSPDRNSGNDAASNFRITTAESLKPSDIDSSKNIDVMTSDDKKNHKTWNLSYIKQFSFKVCLVEQGSESIIKNKVFKVVDSEGNKITYAKTRNSDGCLVWNEPYFYNYLAASKYLQMKRKIVAEGLYSGSSSFHIVINPWAGRAGDDVVPSFIPEYETNKIETSDYEVLTNIEDIAKALKGSFGTKAERSNDGELFLDKFDFAFNTMGGKNPSEHFLEIKSGLLYTNVRKANGDYVRYNLDQGGAYAIKTKVIQVSKTAKVGLDDLSKYHPLYSIRDDNPKSVPDYPKFYLRAKKKSDTNPLDNFSTNGQLNGNIPLILWPRKGSKEMRLLLDISSVDFPYENFLKPLQAVYRSTGHENGSATLVKESEHKMIGQKYKSKKHSFDSLMSDEVNLNNEGKLPVYSEFYTKKVKPAFLGIPVGETLTNRGIRYSVATCLTQRKDRQPLQEEEVEIRIYNMSKGSDINFLNNRIDAPLKKMRKKKTDENGCISMEDEIWYRHYKPEKYLEYKMTINQVGSEQSVSLDYIINPWDEGWTFSQDKRDVSREFLATNRDQKKIKSRLFLPRFSYETLRFKYNIDKYLNLNVLKQVLFNFSATTLRYNSNKSGRFGIYHQRDGIYLLKTAMEKNYLDPSTTGVWVRGSGANCQLGDGSCLSKTQIIQCPKGTNDCEKEKQSYLESPFTNHNRPDIRMRRHLDVVSRLVRVVGGQIVTPVAFETNDLRVMRLRSNLFVQIDPVDEWRLWMSKLYYKFYQDLFESKNPGKRMSLKYQNERAANIKEIIRVMEKNPRFLHNSKIVKGRLETRYLNLDEEAMPIKPETAKFSGKRYDVCQSPENLPITWEEILEVFNLTNSHQLLGSLVGGSLSQAHKDITNNAELYKKDDGSTCLRVYNVVRDLLENDIQKMPLNPIDYVELSNFIDKDSGLEQSTFFGPMTYLENGNASNMRPTKNISEFVCPSGDCDEHKNDDELTHLLESEMDKYVRKNPTQLELKNPNVKENSKDIRYKVANLPSYESNGSTVYETSRYFGSLKYANNLLVYNYENPDEVDLESEMKRLNDLNKKENEIKSKLFYYLNNFNLKFVSLGDEKVKYYDPSQSGCDHISKVPYENLVDESQCFEEIEEYTDHKLKEKLFISTKSKNDVKKMIQSLTISPSLAEKICTHQLESFMMLQFNPKGSGFSRLFSDDRRAPVIERQKGKSRFLDLCIDELVNQENIDPVKKFDIINGKVLDIERKVRVIQTGDYAFKGGKALNVNVSNQQSLTHSTSYSFSESRGIGWKEIKNIFTGWIPDWIKDMLKPVTGIFDAGAGMVVGDQKWTDSDSNATSEGTSVAEGTFLVMQNATLDVKLKNYYQCVTITFSETFINNTGVQSTKLKESGKLDPLIRSFAKREGIDASEADLFKRSKDIKDSLLKGLMICDESEVQKSMKYNGYGEAKELPIRENFYYFTQHFTEGDMLDAGDLANHPWLKAIRGKTDMWRFLAKVRNQDKSLKGKGRAIPYEKYLPLLDKERASNKKGSFGLFKRQRGDLDLGDEWPIYQLIKAYHGTVPTFPGVYSAIHSPCNYSMDFPWGDQAEESFDPVVAKRFNDFEGVVDKFHEESFLDSLRKENPHIYKSDSQISLESFDRSEQNNYRISMDSFGESERTLDKDKSDQYYSENFPIGLYYDTKAEIEARSKKMNVFTGIVSGIWEKMFDSEKGSNEPSDLRIKACHGYIDN